MCRHLTNPKTGVKVNTDDTDLAKWLILHGFKEVKGDVSSDAGKQRRRRDN